MVDREDYDAYFFFGTSYGLRTFARCLFIVS